MREILFRGKRKDNGEWVCSGNLIQFFDNNIREVYISQYGERCNAVHDIYTDNIETITCENGARFYKVIPETVGQYTGLTDKNGNKIFEGDVILHEQTVWCSEKKTSREKQTRVVWFNRCGWEGKIIGGESCSYDLYTPWGGDTFEVLGSIYDNPELLKEGAE